MFGAPSSQRQGHPGARDRRRSRAPVRLEHVAIDPDGVLAQRIQVVDRPQRAAEQALDPDRAPEALPDPASAMLGFDAAAPDGNGQTGADEVGAAEQSEPEPTG